MYVISQCLFADCTIGAALLFALALLASGQSASIVGTVAAQCVSEGFLHWKVSVVLYLLGLLQSLMAVPLAHSASSHYAHPWDYPFRNRRLHCGRKRHKHTARRKSGRLVHRSSIRYFPARLSHVFITLHVSQVTIRVYVCIANPSWRLLASCRRPR